MRNVIPIFYGIPSVNPSTGWIPYGPLTVASILKSAGYETIFVDEFKTPDYQELLKPYSDRILFFGISSFSGVQIERSLKAAEFFRQIAPEAPIVWGGAHATAMPDQSLKHPLVDIAFVGRAKENLLDLAKAIQNNRSVQSIPDVLTEADFQDKSDYRIQEYDMDYSSFLGYRLSDYDFSYLVFSKKVLNYTTSTGCRGNCSFCSWGGRHPWRHLPLDIVLDDLEHLVKKYQLTTIWFSDASLTADKEYFLQLAQGIIDRKLGVYWHCCSRVDEMARMTTDDFELLERSGLDAVFVGVENVNRKNMVTIRKRFNPDTFTDVVKRIKPYNIFLMTAYIFGIPGSPLDDLEENRKQIDTWRAINPKMRIQVSFFTPYPGTALGKVAEDAGFKMPQTLEECANSGFYTEGTNRLVDLRKAEIPWYGKDGDDYVRRYYEVFPVTEYNDWNRRQNEEGFPNNPNRKNNTK